ncbi:GyrI-like domain-containing protein [Nocardia brasiliensis]|uniref:GyrI-like domain-containing protein n=1 Tax=Nocardia brasiliensis TaxID=37326 RepID=UPI001EEC457F|nr:GyrI-like domain-containing protein [Nocardia brasiliensis]
MPSGYRIRLPTPAGYAALKLQAWCNRSANSEYQDAADLTSACGGTSYSVTTLRTRDRTSRPADPRRHGCGLDLFPVNTVDAYDFAIVDLPAIDKAATVVHRGSMQQALEPWQALGRWIDENGYRTVGPSREVALVYTEDESGWVTELQEPIVAK